MSNSLYGLYGFDQDKPVPPPSFEVDGVKWVGPVIGKFDGGSVEYRATFDKFALKFTHLNGISKGSISTSAYPLCEWDMVDVSPDDRIDGVLRNLRNRAAAYLYQMHCAIKDKR